MAEKGLYTDLALFCVREDLLFEGVGGDIGPLISRSAACGKKR